MELKKGALVNPTGTTTARVYVGVDVSKDRRQTSACDGANPKAAKRHNGFWSKTRATRNSSTVTVTGWRARNYPKV
jgi:hypothetical protein